MHPRRPLLVALGLVLTACSGATGAGTEVSTAEAIIQMGDAVNELRQQNAEIQTQLDSIHAALARHDTLIARLQAMSWNEAKRRMQRLETIRGRLAAR